MNTQIKKNIEVVLDGSLGEGGGQILRTALSLSMVTGIPFRIDHIRAKRPKPGLLRQHLTCVDAATAICGAQVQGAVLGATSVRFSPGAVKAGEYKFAIGSAGSCTLVFQTVLPALMLAARPSQVSFEGGTHNGMSPPFHFIERTFLPQLRRMGASVAVKLDRFGFYPAGGGRFLATISPVAELTPIHLDSRGASTDGFAESVIAGIPVGVAERELMVIGAGMGWANEKLHIRGIDQNQGPGNVVMITLAFEDTTEVFTAFGEKGISSESVANRAIHAAKDYLASGVAVSEHLADQLMIPFALAGSGSFVASQASEHARTNASVIKQFLALDIEMESLDSNSKTNATRFRFSC